MNEDQSQLLVQWVRETAEKGQGFVEREAPLLAGEIVSWYFTGSLMMAGSGVVLIIAAIFAAWACRRFMFDEIGPNPLFLLSLIPSFLGLFFVCQGSYDATKACVAPRLVVVEQIAAMAKGK